MHRKSIYVEAPSAILATLGGAVATVLVTAWMYGAPALGLPLVDLPSLLGGLFTASLEAALAWGYLIFFLVGWLLIPAAARLLWTRLPGDPVAAGGAALKGLLVGAGAWVLAGVALGLVGPLSRVGDDPGFFAAEHGLAGVLTLLVGHLAYGVALTIVAAMGRGLSPLDAVGWLGRGAGRHA